MNKISQYIKLNLKIAAAALTLLAATPVYARNEVAPGPMPESVRAWKPAFSADSVFEYHKWEGATYRETDLDWHADILPGYEARYVDQGESYDGPCRSTIVRRLCGRPTGKAILYIHGFNDYFFQSEMGEIYNREGYDFYAVDLRRYGRSLLPWQYPFMVRNFDEYFGDIDAAIAQIQRDGHTDISLLGHSTGGLTVLYYCARRGPRCQVRRVLTDSPFLEWNFPPLYRKMLIPLVGFWGKIGRNTLIPQSHCDAYAASLLRHMHGEWSYDTRWKMIYSPSVKASWIGAVSAAQNYLMKKGRQIYVPVLVMHSSRRYSACTWDSTCMTADIVLDPVELQKRGQKLGYNTTVCAIDSGIHDLILSPQPHRQAAYDTILNFIATH